MNEKSPFNTIISSQYEEKIGDIYELFQEFYHSLFERSNIAYAIKSIYNKKKDARFFIKNSKELIKHVIIFNRKRLGKYEDIHIQPLLQDFENRICNNFLFAEDRDELIIWRKQLESN